MKKLSYIALSVCIAGLFACTKQLDQIPVSSVQTSNFYSNQNDFNQAVTGVYNRLRAIPTQSLWMGEVRSDNVIVTSDGNRDWQGINDFSPNLSNTAFIVGAWNNDYSGIYDANSVIEALTSKGSNISDSTVRRRYMAEVRFLRAFYYFDLVRYFGKVPIVDRTMTKEEIATVPRSPVADVYNLIIGDLQYAISNLPASYTSSDVGRATSWAAKGMLGLVYMTRSGPTYGVEGPGLNSNEYDKALAIFNEIIASNQFQFLPSYPSIFSYTNENNKEVIFDIQFMTTNNGAEFPSQLTPDAYWTGLGLSGYNNGYGTATYNVTKDLLASYRNGTPGKIDTRDTFSIAHGWATNSSQPTVLDTTRPFLKKYINVAKRGTSRSDWPINWIVLRYTDVLMMKAECILHGAGGTQADVDAIVNQVRTRAGLSTITNVDLPTLMEERRKEFFGEGIRWNDLVREGMAVTTMNNWIKTEGVTTINAVVPQYIIYPVPQAEILAAPGLYTQNAGY